MARRMLSALLVLCALIFWGCVQETEERNLEVPAKFYYKVSADHYGQSDSAMEYELRETASFQGDWLLILGDYLQGPQSARLVSPFPKGTRLISAKMVDRVLELNFSQELGQLTEIDLTVACSCITMTCLNITEAQSVRIRANGKRLGNSESILLRAEDLILEDTGVEGALNNYMLYFSDTDNRYLIGEALRSDLEDQELASFLLERLIAGTQTPGLAQTIPLDTQVRNLQIIEGVCNLDLSGTFVQDAPKTVLAQRMTILSLTNTLTQLEGIQQLVLYVDGRRLESYGTMDLSQPLTFESGAIGPARLSLNELDVDLYLYIGANDRLSWIPVRIQQAADKLMAEQVLQALLSYEDQNGYHSHIPQNTQALDLEIVDSVCIVTLSQEFLEATSDLGAKAIAATILQTGQCEAVELRVRELEETAEVPWLNIPFVWDESWLTEG